MVLTGETEWTCLQTQHSFAPCRAYMRSTA